VRQLIFHNLYSFHEKKPNKAVKVPKGLVNNQQGFYEYFWRDYQKFVHFVKNSQAIF